MTGKRTTTRAILLALGLSAMLVAPASAGVEGRTGHVEAHRSGHLAIAGAPGLGRTAVRVPVALSLAAATGGECPPQLSCGYGCTAELTSWYCTVTFSWEGGIKVGGAQIGPTLEVECYVCECWYIMPGPNGSLFQRTVDFGCGASFNGLEYE